MTDIEIAQNYKPIHIRDIANVAHIDEKYIEYYGNNKAKIDLSYLEETNREDGKLILVTAITPTPAGEGKTTTTIGLADGLRQIGKDAVVAIREPSLGPVFGVKGGAAGGGYAQVVPMEDINLHFTGDFHAIGAANNLLAAMIDNHIYQGNKLNIDPRTITWRRCVDMNDRQLRNIVDGLGSKANGVPREDGYDITVASEVMAILCLATSISDLKNRLSEIIVGYTFEGNPVKCGDIGASGAMTALLKDAIKPNLVQTLEGTPAFVHGGPFANIAHGCNSVLATKMALKSGDYVITEAGFGADLGAEKFFDIKCRQTGLVPDAVVIVATARALKYHGGVDKKDLNQENVEAVYRGIDNLYNHIVNIERTFGILCTVAINRFTSDTDAEIDAIKLLCEKIGVPAYVSNSWEQGGKGAIELAEEVVNMCKDKNKLYHPYHIEDSIETKIYKMVYNVYHGKGVNFSPVAKRQIEKIEAMGYTNLPICVAKTQYSFSDNPTLRNAPSDFTMNVKNVKLCAGAGFIVVLTGDILTMPGLPAHPAALDIDVDDTGKISGLF